MKKLVITTISFTLLLNINLFAQINSSIVTGPKITKLNDQTGPDLIISEASVKAISATSITINFAIKNIGNRPYLYKQADLEFYFSNDDVINFSGNNSGSIPFSNMGSQGGFSLASGSPNAYHGTFTLHRNQLNTQYCMMRIRVAERETNYDNNVFRLYLH